MFVSLLEHLQPLRKPGRLLDVGCGGGHLLAIAEQFGWHGLGTDLSQPACTATRQAYGLSVAQADATAIPLHQTCVDTVTLINVLDHTADPLRTLQEAYRVLVPGGMLIIRVPNAAFHRPWARLLASLGPVVRWYGWDGYPVLHLYAFTAGGLRRLAERAGFRILEMRNSTLTAKQTRRSGVEPADLERRWTHGLVRAMATGVEIVTRQRCLVGPSLELYALRPD